MQNQPPYSPGGTLSTGHYEFTDEENAIISTTGARASMWGFVSIVTGVLALVGLVVSLLFKAELVAHGLEPSYVTVFVVSLVPIVLTHLVISMLYVGAGKSLQAVVHTQGNDIEHLMQSLNKLGTAFLVEFAIGMLAVVISTGVGIQMAIDNIATEKAAELARAEAQAAALAAAADEDDEDDEDDEGEGADDEDADDEDDEGEDAEDDTEAADEADGQGDTDAAAEGEEGEAQAEGASGGQGEDAEGADGEEAADSKPAEAEIVDEPAEEPSAG